MWGGISKAPLPSPRSGGNAISRIASLRRSLGSGAVTPGTAFGKSLHDGLVKGSQQQFQTCGSGRLSGMHPMAFGSVDCASAASLGGSSGGDGAGSIRGTGRATAASGRSMAGEQTPSGGDHHHSAVGAATASATANDSAWDGSSGDRSVLRTASCPDPRVGSHQSSVGGGQWSGLSDDEPTELPLTQHSSRADAMDGTVSAPPIPGAAAATAAAAAFRTSAAASAAAPAVGARLRIGGWRALLQGRRSAASRGSEDKPQRPPPPPPPQQQQTQPQPHQGMMQRQQSIRRSALDLIKDVSGRAGKFFRGGGAK